MLPSGLTDTPKGFAPTATVAVTVLVAVLITDTLLELRLAIYAVGALDGVTVIVPVVALPPLLKAVNAGILPVPLAARPIDVLLLVQL